MVDWDRVPIILFGSIQYLAILLSWFDKDVLWHDKAMWDKAPDPVCYTKYVNVTFFFVYGGHDLVPTTGYGWVVTILPVEQSICSCGRGIEVVWAAHVMTLVYWEINDSSCLRHWSCPVMLVMLW